MSRNLSRGRKYDSQAEKKTLYIYCEGTVTEPKYFDAIKQELRLPEIHIETIGKAVATITLVEEALKERGDNLDDEFWVVFDKDDHPNFNKAIERAVSEGLQVAYSNECFELWFILHFEYLQTGLGRGAFKNKLNQLLATEYLKNMDVYQLIKDKEAVAIKNAKKLEQMHDDNNVVSPEKRVPSTAVYKLVEHLRQLKN